jgi:hypothetical protein
LSVGNCNGSDTHQQEFAYAQAMPAFRIWKRIRRALTGPLIENGIPTEALIAHVIRQTIGTPDRCPKGTLGGFAGSACAFGSG